MFAVTGESCGGGMTCIALAKAPSAFLASQAGEDIHAPNAVKAPPALMVE